MNILHLSDFHYQDSNSSIYRKYFNSIVAELKQEKIDLLVFTGDLVDKKCCELQVAYDYLKKELIDNIDDVYTVFACGNHDIDRKQVSSIFKSYISDLDSDELVGEFIVNNDNDDFTSNTKHIEDYRNFVQNNTPEHDSMHRLVDIYKLENNEDLSISIVSYNLSWLAYNENNYGALWFPEKILDKVIESVKSSDFKILITHQPLRFVHPNNYKQLTRKVFSNFDCIFTGHTHQEDMNTIISSSGGILSCNANNISNVHSVSYPVGFTFININLDNYKAKYKSYEYIKTIEKMKCIVEDVIDIPIDKEKKQRISINNNLISKCELLIEESNRKFIPSFKDNINFLDIFTSPTIKKEKTSQDIELEEDKIKTYDSIEYKDLFNDKSLLISGKNKSGKTALLYKMCIDYIYRFQLYGTVPVYLDLQEYYRGSTIYNNLRSIIRSYYNLSNTEVNFLLENYKILLLMDNYDENLDIVNGVIFDSIVASENVRFVLTVQAQNLENAYNTNIAVDEVYYIHDINKKKIREITEKWPTIKNYKKNEIVEKVTIIFKQLNIHFNFWTVSLFLWIFEKTGSVNLHNNVELIDLYIENLLEKSNLVLSLKSQTFSYENYREYLSEIAYFLYKNKIKEGYVCSLTELLKVFDVFTNDNIRIVADAKEIIDYILEKGIIVKKDVDQYTFRLNGVFEYFLARYMLKSEAFKSEIVSNSSTFLSFKNELEIYSGFNRSDENLLIQLYFNCVNAQKLLIEKSRKFSEIQLDVPDEGVKLITELQEVIEEIKDEIKPLSYEEQDSLDEVIGGGSEINSQIKPKLTYVIDEIDAELYLRHLSILSRVFRNLDKINDSKTINEILDFIVTQTCYSIVYVLDELIVKVKKDLGSADTIENIIDFFKSFSPIFVHTFLFDELAHPTLEKLIRIKIDELRNDIENNQFLLFIYYFMIIEFDPLKYHDLIEDIVNSVKSKSLLYSIFTKVLMYVAFKCNGNKKLEMKLHKDLETLYKMLFPKKKSSAKENVNKIFDQLKLVGTD
ncbi:metallophosphoesterase [Marispirochaeta sp.]|uniref:metallophosphoesterase n=1 Tax=Marispirochaeta sp. TaxID=2038653 RepID=UPI0029C9198A|nr:metallophosphoesterase [Marispirochaeta sp.]